MGAIRIQATIQSVDLPYIERFLKGISATEINIENEEDYFSILTPQDLKMISISQEEGNFGKVTTADELFEEIKELRERKWK